MSIDSFRRSHMSRAHRTLEYQGARGIAPVRAGCSEAGAVFRIRQERDTGKANVRLHEIITRVNDPLKCDLTDDDRSSM